MHWLPIKFNNTSKIFLLTVIISIIVELYLIEPLFRLGLGHDDWILITRYRLMGSNPIAEFFNFYKKFGPYITTDGFHISLLFNLFQTNYLNIHIVNVFLKSLAAVAVFPFVYLLTKNKLLAFLTTFLYATSYTATSSFELSSKGTNYFASFWMLIYFIFYYFIITRYWKQWYHYIILALTFWLAILISPSRMYPLLQVPLLIESFMVITKGFSYAKTSLLRLGLIYLPGILIILYVPDQVFYNLSRKPEFLIRITSGEWQALLTPLTGLGFMILPPDYLVSLFKLPMLASHSLYFLSILPYSIFFFVIFLALNVTRIKGSWKYILSYGLLYICLSLVIYQLTFNSSSYDTIVPALTGGFVLITAILSLYRWMKVKNNKDPLLIALAIGPVIALWFITYTWYLANYALQFHPIHSYLTIPALGGSLWVGVVLISLSKLKPRFFSPAILIAFALFAISFINFSEIREYWLHKINNGWGADIQDSLYSQLLIALQRRNFVITKPTFIYFDTSQDMLNAEVYDQGFISHIFYRLRYSNNILSEGCMLTSTEDFNSLQKKVVKKLNQLEFNFPTYTCFIFKDKGFVQPSGSFVPEQIYAFRLMDQKVIDITDEVLYRLSNEQL